MILVVTDAVHNGMESVGGALNPHRSLPKQRAAGAADARRNAERRQHAQLPDRSAWSES